MLSVRTVERDDVSGLSTEHLRSNRGIDQASSVAPRDRPNALTNSTVNIQVTNRSVIGRNLD